MATRELCHGEQSCMIVHDERVPSRGELSLETMTRLHVVAGRKAGERRVALLPDQVGRFRSLGFSVAVEHGAGHGIDVDDRAYEEQGAELAEPRERDRADVVLAIDGVPKDDCWKEGAVLVGLLLEDLDRDCVETLLRRGVDAHALELLPRTSRAQPMDALTSQATCAGYHGAVLAAAHHQAFFPMMTTAFGTLRPARILVLGAGVAGLSALATVRRLGAEAWGYDVRKIAREQVESLGARFLDAGIDATTVEGYARPLTAEELKRQEECLAEHLKNMDVVITTALLVGRRAPILLEEHHIALLQPGSLVVDLAIDGGGNCRLSRASEEVVHHGVRILAPRRPAAGLARHASAMLGRNFHAFLQLFMTVDQRGSRTDDPLLSATALTRRGRLLHPQVFPSADDPPIRR